MKTRLTFARIVLALLVLLPISLFAQERVSLSENIKTVNVFSGIPQAIDGPTKLTGFGDIAANLVASVELKKRYPDRTVRLVVTSAQKRYDPLIATSNEIVKIMVPSLDPERKGVVQMHEGVEVIFIDYDFGNVLNEEKYQKLPYFMQGLIRKFQFRNIMKKLPQLLPRSDLNLNFSHFQGSGFVMRINTKLAIGAEEHYGSQMPVNDVQRAGIEDLQAPFVELTSGPNSFGFQLAKERPSRSEAYAEIHAWAQKSGIELPSGEFRHAMSYSVGWQMAQIYIDAIAEMGSAEPLVLFIKEFPELDFSRLPSNVQVVRFKGLPHPVMSAMIQEAVLSPAVTGDISLGQTLSSVKPGKTLIYESPEWKVESAAPLRSALAQDVGVYAHDLRGLVYTTASLMKMTREDLRETSREVAKFLGDMELQNRLYQAIESRKNRWDLLDNTLRIAEGILTIKKTGKMEIVERPGWELVKSTVLNLVGRLYGKETARAPRLSKQATRLDAPTSTAQVPTPAPACLQLFGGR